MSVLNSTIRNFALSLAIAAIAIPASAQFITETRGSHIFPDSITLGTSVSGKCVQTGTLGVLQPVTCPTPSSSGVPLTIVEPTGSTISALSNGNSTTYSGPGALPVGFVIGHINVTGAAYNTTDATAGNLPYTALNSDGLGGGTITFGIVNATNFFASPLVLGTVVLPTSPQGGPWVTSVTTTLGSPYTVLPGDGLVTLTNAVDGTAAQWVAQIQAYVGP